MMDRQRKLAARRALDIAGMISFGALTMALAAPAFAQDAPAESDTGPALEDIIVTAQKRSENLQDVPIAVSAFTAETLQSAGVSGSADLVALTPSLRFQFGGPGGTVFLRGVGNSQQFAGAEAEVQTYVDGVYYGSAGAAYLRFNNIERIEVAKGPQGTLFGRNATGGVIQIITRDPGQEFKLDASAGYGKYNAVEGDLYVGGGLSKGVAADIAVHFEDRDGWGRNIVRNTDAFAANSFAVRSKWVFDLSGSFRATLIGDYSRDRSDLGVSYVLRAAPWRLALTDPIPPIPSHFTSTSGSPERVTIDRYGASLKLDADIGALNFISITGGRYTKSRGLIDPDGTAALFFAGDETRKETQFSQEFQLLSGSDSKLEWILGTYFYYNKAKMDPAALQAAFLAGFGAQSVESRSYVETHSAAIFGQATYDLTETTHLTGGLRYTYDHRRQDARNTLFNAAGAQVAPPPFLVLNINNNPTADFKALTGKITLAQDLSDDAMIYIGYSRGFKSGTFNNFQVLSNPGPALQPQTIDAYEGGIKADVLDRRVRLNFAAFYYKYSNLQVNQFVLAPTPSIVLRNAAGAEIKGIEGEMQFALANNTRLSGGFGYLDAKYTSFPGAPTYIINPITVANPGGGFGGILNAFADGTGKRMPQAPEFSGYIGIMQGIETSYGDIDLNANLSYSSRVYFTPDNQFSQKPSALLSASAKWTSRDGAWDFSIWGRNLTNQKTDSNITISSTGARGGPNEPVAYGARVGVHF